MPSVLITGCSSGFGLETAKLFLEQGWNVIATMRKPDASVLPASDNLTLLPLDVTDPASIKAAIDRAGAIDVLVNNAGFGGNAGPARSSTSPRQRRSSPCHWSASIARARQQ
jgi:NAD(P)-dependent dehydrogenase (short-subunit alcohol dehydrogenase family)